MIDPSEDVKRAVMSWWNGRQNHRAAYTSLSVPVDALPYLRSLWMERGRYQAQTDSPSTAQASEQ